MQQQLQPPKSRKAVEKRTKMQPKSREKEDDDDGDDHDEDDGGEKPSDSQPNEHEDDDDPGESGKRIPEKKREEKRGLSVNLHPSLDFVSSTSSFGFETKSSPENEEKRFSKRNSRSQREVCHIFCVSGMSLTIRLVFLIEKSSYLSLCQPQGKCKIESLTDR